MYICCQSILVGSDISYNFLIKVFALILPFSDKWITTCNSSPITFFLAILLLVIFTVDGKVIY